MHWTDTNLARTSTVAELDRRARRWVPAGTHSNSRIREPHVFYAARAEGSYLWDADGNRWIDFVMGNGSVLLGHGHPKVNEAVHAAVTTGLTTGHETADAVAAVELLADLIPDCGLVRFANTGTEAIMHAIAIARHATGRPRVAKAESSYHGWADPVWVSTWPSPDEYGHPATPATVPGSAGLGHEAADTLVLPFNDPDATEKLLDAHADELAAVIVEPVLIDIGYVPASREYLHRLREVSDRHGIVLIFDELLTGFRIAPGGARQVYGVRADLTTFGKAMANGWPVAAVEGRAELMNHTDPTQGGPVGWVGTYNGHAAAMAATQATLTVLRADDVLPRVDAITQRLCTEFEALASHYGIAAVMPGQGGHFQPYFCPTPPDNYRSALASNPSQYANLASAGADRHILLADKPLLHSAMSAAHTDSDVDAFLDAAERAFVDMDRT